MSILERVKDLISANINDVLEKAEDPQKMADEYLRQLSEQYYEARAELATAMADETRLEQKLVEQQGEVEKWQGHAETALRNGKEDLARQALQRKVQAQKLASQYEEQYRVQDEQVESLQEGLAALEARIAQTQARRDLIVAKKNRLRTQETIQTTARHVRRVTAIDKLNQLEDRVDYELLKSEAMAELEKETLENEFKELAEASEVDSELEQLKQKMGVS
jgi:phage shock protein A